MNERPNINICFLILSHPAKKKLFLSMKGAKKGSFGEGVVK